MAAPSIRDYIATAAKAGIAGSSPQFYDITLPTYAAGDLVVIHLLINAGNLGTPDPLTGWTLQDAYIACGSGTSVKTATYTRIMDGSEGSTVHIVATTFNAYNWKAVASSWQHVDATTPVAAVSSNTSGSAVHTTTWSLGTLSGAFTAGLEAYWGGQYLKLNSDDGISNTEIGTLTVQLFNATDITTAFAADYDVLDASGLLVGANQFRHVLARQANFSGSGARIWKRF
jgi:hypothetical protein